MQIDAALGHIIRSQTLDELTALLFNWRDEARLANLVYYASHVPNAATAIPILLLTYDPAWVGHYTAMDYFQIDPVLTAAEQTNLPVDWMNVDRSSAAAAHFFAEAESYGVGRQGYTMPLRGPFGERGFFSLTANDQDMDWLKWRYDHLRDFHLLSHYYHDRVMVLSNSRPKGKPSLSRRELQCLHKLADGLTPQQVAGHFDISESAVTMNLRSARNKLDAVTNEHAVVKALAYDLFNFIM